MALRLPRKINKTWIIVGVAIVAGTIAALGSMNLLTQKLAEIEARKRSAQQVVLVVPKNNLKVGTVLKPENVATRPFPREWAPSGAIMSDQFARAAGSILAHPVGAGEAIMWAHLETKREPNFSATLAPGRRAVTVPVNSISSISGMLQPGDLIDLIVTVRGKARNNKTFTLLQSVTVLATGKYTTPGQNEADRRTYRTVTLDTSPEDAKRVISARNLGSITALLRAPNDDEPVSTEILDDRKIVGLIKDRPPRRPRPKPFEVQVLYGDDMGSTIRQLNQEQAGGGARHSYYAQRERSQQREQTEEVIKDIRQAEADSMASAVEKALSGNDTSNNQVDPDFRMVD